VQRGSKAKPSRVEKKAVLSGSLVKRSKAKKKIGKVYIYQYLKLDYEKNITINVISFYFAECY